MTTTARHDGWIGLRVARWRDVAGLTQLQLADAVGVTREYISMIENGRRAITKRSLLIGLANALGVAVTDLTALPLEPRTPDDHAIHGAVAAVRVALDGDPEQVELPHPDRIAADADHLMRARMACDYPSLAVLLPRVIAEARDTIALTSSDQARTTARRALVQGAVFGCFALKTAGYVDLAMRLAERAERVAAQLGDPVYMAAAKLAAAQAGMATGIRKRALAASNEGAALVADRIEDDNDAATWYGMMQLQAALCSAALDRPDDATAMLDEADRVARMVIGNPWHMDFSSADVAIWRVGVALENGQPERAPEIARTVNTTLIRSPQRRARLYMDTARGLYAETRPVEATRAFRQALDIAPAEVRRRAAVREIVGQMVRDSPVKGGSDELRDLALAIGIDPLTPDGHEAV